MNKKINLKELYYKKFEFMQTEKEDEINHKIEEMYS